MYSLCKLSYLVNISSSFLGVPSQRVSLFPILQKFTKKDFFLTMLMVPFLSFLISSVVYETLNILILYPFGYNIKLFDRFSM